MCVREEAKEQNMRLWCIQSFIARNFGICKRDSMYRSMAKTNCVVAHSNAALQTVANATHTKFDYTT